MQVRHPEALDDVGGECPDRVDLGGDAYDCGDGRAFDASEAQVEALAERYGVDVAAIAVGEETEPDPSDADESGPTAAGDAVCTCDPGEACDACGGNCPTVKTDAEVCGRDRPCPYHD